MHVHTKDQIWILSNWVPADVPMLMYTLTTSRDYDVGPDFEFESFATPAKPKLQCLGYAAGTGTRRSGATVRTVTSEAQTQGSCARQPCHETYCHWQVVSPRDCVATRAVFTTFCH